MSNRYLVAIMLTDQVGTEIAEIQDRFRVSTWPKNIGPHITLYPPFTVTDEAELIKELTTISHQFTPFSIYLVGAGFFRRKSSVIFARVKSGRILERLQKQILRALSPLAGGPSNVSRSFHPHVTLSNRLTSEVFNWQRMAIKQLSINFQFVCQDFSLLRLDRGQWREVEKFTFLRAGSSSRLPM